MPEFHPGYVLNAVVYAAAGLLVFALSFLLIQRLLPDNPWKQIVDEKNVGVAVLLGAMSIAMGLIVAAAFH